MRIDCRQIHHLSTHENGRFCTKALFSFDQKQVLIDSSAYIFCFPQLFQAFLFVSMKTRKEAE